MYHVPGVENLHALRDSLNVIVKARLPIGRDGRNRPSLFPFATVTGRNAQAKSLFNAHAGMRSFITFPEDAIGVYLDWRTQEVGIGAARSGDQALMDAYRSGDVYHAFALDCGLTGDTNIKRWKKAESDVRQRMKSLYLGIMYGMGAKSLNRHPLIASALIERHKKRYPRFWEWRMDRALTAMLDRETTTVFSWPLRISTSPNKRTLFNFGCQANGAEMLRLAAMGLCDAGIVPNMLVHDGILLELHNREQIEQAKGDHACSKPRGVQRLRDRCRSGPAARARGSFPRQATDRHRDVDHDDAGPSGGRRYPAGRIAVSKDNVFSLNRFRTKGWSEQTVEAAKEVATPEVKKATPRRRPRAETTFVRLPYQPITQLYGRLSAAAFHVMVELDHQHFKNRVKALRELQDAGLITLQKEGKGAFVVTISWHPVAA
jgi:DNA polymerase family A